jgi:hypothetical protein
VKTDITRVGRPKVAGDEAMWVSYALLQVKLPFSYVELPHAGSYLF